ncbi:DUF4158 domain-containing protein [Thermobifida halotolerans]|uniref:DUF4158 domain-containing protein n=1 Tax=Thermobifida halotolerans TaxID=483545 RepID=UPI0008396808
MRQGWTPEELVDEWTLEQGDRELVGNKSGATRLGFALLLKFFQIEGCIPTYAEEIPAAAVEFVADQVTSRRPCSPSMPGSVGRSSTTVIRSATSTAHIRPPRMKRTSSPTDWPTRCARWRSTATSSPRPFGAGAAL